MSVNFALQRVNESFDQIATWYREFMARTERSLQAVNARLRYLEDRQAWKGPSDEQVERVLRKILAERFGDPGNQLVVNPNIMKNGDTFVQKPTEDLVAPKPLQIDSAFLRVELDAVPSEAYKKDMDRLNEDIQDFPKGIPDGTESTKDLKNNPIHGVKDQNRASSSEQNVSS